MRKSMLLSRFPAYSPLPFDGVYPELVEGLMTGT
jgi:hypothetical protein